MPLLANRRRTDAALAQHAEHAGIGAPPSDQNALSLRPNEINTFC
jgi:hypothetical protein